MKAVPSSETSINYHTTHRDDEQAELVVTLYSGGVRFESMPGQQLS
jgi:hypothetical protein